MTTYNGNNVLGVNFNLYNHEDIDFDSTSDSLVNLVQSQTEEINARLQQIGLKMTGAHWYSPRYYNHNVDSVDIDIEVVDPEKYITYIQEDAEKLQVLMDKNKSYDGYIALTVKSPTEEIHNIRAGKAPDVIPIYYVLRGVIDDDDIIECWVYDSEF